MQYCNVVCEGGYSHTEMHNSITTRNTEMVLMRCVFGATDVSRLVATRSYKRTVPIVTQRAKILHSCRENFLEGLSQVAVMANGCQGRCTYSGEAV